MKESITEEESPIEENNFKKEVIDFLKDLIIIVIVVLFITHYFISIFIINGQSMYSSYYDKEIILVDRFSANSFHGLKEQNIKRGDVVVIEPNVDKDKKYFIKRVIGLPNEELKIEGGNVFIKKVGENEFNKLDEKYLNKRNYGKTRVSGAKGAKIYKIPEGKYFVMGDNRNGSTDSRACFYNCNIGGRDEYIKNKFVIGKVLVDFGYFNLSNFSFTHPVLKENGKYISTKPKWTSSPDSYTY